MSIIAPATALWTCDDGSIRVTAAGQPSVFDMIKVLGGQKAPHKCWERLTVAHPEILSWVVFHKFSGRGQRFTPVLKDESKASILTTLIQDRHTKASRASKRAGLSSLVTERAIQTAIVTYMAECNEDPTEFVRCSTGVADIVTNTYVIEVKNVNLWKAAVGQALIYATELQKFPEVALFGRGNFDIAFKTCTDMNVLCSCYPSDHHQTRGMLRGEGAAAMSNVEQVGRNISARSRARFN